jgi:hypothetical protein
MPFMALILNSSFSVGDYLSLIYKIFLIPIFPIALYLTFILHGTSDLFLIIINILLVIISAAIYFIIGAIIGLIIQKIRGKNESFRSNE